MADMQEYKCPCCGGAIEFNSAVQKMKCPYCDTEFEMDTLKGYDRRSMVTSWFLVGCRIARLLLCCVQAGAGGSGTCGLPGVVLVWS